MTTINQNNMSHNTISIFKRLLPAAVCMLLGISAAAQSFSVSGSIKDASGLSVIGASVIEDGTSNGTVTDVDGTFTINVKSSDAKLTISSIGYKTVTVSVDGRRRVDVIMEEDAELLEETIVVGYGTMKKKDLTGAVASVGEKAFESAAISNIGQALQGKLSGVQVLDAGRPGSDVTIKIRGLGTINDSNPLIVIDGIPTDLGLTSLNMADVERVDVLKDASATAIYGSRGANGVVMVTTKRGKGGEGRIHISVNGAMQNATNVPEMLNAQQYAELSNEMLSAAGYETNPAWSDPSVLTESTDWLDQIMRTAYKQDYSVAYSGGNEKNAYYVSGGYVNQTGIIEGVEYQRFNFKVNNDTQVKPWLKFITSVTFSADDKLSGGENISDAMNALPTQPVRDENGEWSGPSDNPYWYGSIRNPLGSIRVGNSNTKGYNLLASIAGEVTITKWLKFRSNFGYDQKMWYNESFTPAYAFKPIPIELSTRYESSDRSFTYLWDNYFTFDHTFAKKHYVNIMAGTSAQWNHHKYMTGEMKGYLFDNVNQLNNGLEMSNIGGSESSWALMSYMARANYSYDDKYLLTATVRYDGSSRFGANNRWGCFPSASAAWRISNEEFFPAEALRISDLKLRAGYGVTGNQSIGNYGYIASYDTSVYPLNGTNSSALVSTTLSNPNLHWEEVAQANIGLDASFFKNRLSFTVDAYWKNTTDMLVKAAIPITSGLEDTSTTYTNAGKVSNRGFEFTAHSFNIEGEFTWETSLNATWNRNRIIDLNSETPMYTNQVNNSYLTMLSAGYPINVFYGYVTDGIFQNQDEIDAHAGQVGAQPGDIRFKDLNNDGRINEDDRTVIGNPNPDWLFSMNNTFTWKGFELSLYLQGVWGNEIYNANNIDNEGMAAAYNQTTAVLNRWTGEGTSDTMPRAVFGDPNNNTRVSDRFVENGAYLRLKNLTFAYNIPSKVLEKVKISSARAYISCENLATFSSYSGFDPEVSINGIDDSRYPLSRTISLGINLNF